MRRKVAVFVLTLVIGSLLQTCASSEVAIPTVSDEPLFTGAEVIASVQTMMRLQSAGASTFYALVGGGNNRAWDQMVATYEGSGKWSVTNGS